MCLLQEAFDLLGVMEGAGVSPSVDTYNTLMVACKQRHQLQSVPRIFRRLRMSGVLPVNVWCTCQLSRRVAAACPIGPQCWLHAAAQQWPLLLGAL